MGYRINFAEGGLLGINNITVQNVTTTSTLRANTISIFGNTADITATLPASDAATVADRPNEGSVIRMKHNSTGVTTIAPGGTDTINGSTNNFTLTGDVDFVYAGSGNWITFSYA